MDFFFCAATYVKIYLKFHGKTIAKQKTTLSERSLKPRFNQTITFGPDQVRNTLLVIYV